MNEEYFLYKFRDPHLVLLEMKSSISSCAGAQLLRLALPVFFLFCSVNRVAMKTGINNSTLSASCCHHSTALHPWVPSEVLGNPEHRDEAEKNGLCKIQVIFLLSAQIVGCWVFLFLLGSV